MYMWSLPSIQRPSRMYVASTAHYSLYKHIYLHTRALSGQHSDPCALSALEPFVGDFSTARPRLVARLALSNSPQSRGHVPACGSALAAAVEQR